jgi:hypothetical protein
MMDPQIPHISMTYDWLHFAERTGGPGKQWAIDYRRHRSAVALADESLALLRQGKIESGGLALLELKRQISRIRGEQESVRAVLDRWFHGVSGYYFYCREDFQQAQRSMQEAHLAVRRALSSAEWLMMLAVHCQEFCLHQARIARNQHAWTEMNARVEQARAMMVDQLPLCQKENGQKIYFSSFQDFFHKIGPLTQEESTVAAKITNPAERDRLFDQFVRRMLKFPEVGIEYLHQGLTN